MMPLLQFIPKQGTAVKLIGKSIIQRAICSGISTLGTLPIVLLAISNAVSQGASPSMGIHPGYQLVDIPLKSFNKGFAGMALLPDGKMVAVTYRGTMDKPGYLTTPFKRSNFGQVYLLENLQGDPSGVKQTLIADSLLDAMGVCVVEGQIYIGELDKILKLQDKDGDGKYETKQVIGDFPAKDGYFEYAFGPVFKDGYFYMALGVHTKQTGEPEVQLIENRGTLIRIPASGGKYEVVARGIRSPDGITLGPNEEIFITDNQGSWRPGAAIYHLQPGKFYGYRNTGDDTIAAPVTPPAMWLPYGELNSSPTGVVLMKTGRYAGQLLYGDFANPKLYRAFLDPTHDTYQGAVFPVTGGLKNASHRLVIDDQGVVYVGELVLSGGTPGPQKLVPKPTAAVFEMLAIRARTGGLEIEFSQPVGALAARKSMFNLKHWHYTPTVTYGGPKQNVTNLVISNPQISADSTRVFLAIENMAAGKVIQVSLNDSLKSKSGGNLWFKDAYYTLNTLPSSTPLLDLPKGQRISATKISIRESGGSLECKWTSADYRSLTIRDIQGAVLNRFDVAGMNSFRLPQGLGSRKLLVIELDGQTASASTLAILNP
jgi:hypothetical protein